MNRFIFYIILLGIFLVSCTGEPVTAPVFSVIPKNKDDQISIRFQNQTTILEINSPSGIGSARVTRTSGSMPEAIRVRLHLKGLEEFRLISAHHTITASISSNTDGKFQSQRKLSGNREQILEPFDSLWLVIETKSKSPKIPLADGYFEITFPKEFIQQSDNSFEIQWIDFFR